MNNIKINIIKLSKETKYHNHRYAQIVIPLNSSVKIWTDDTEYNLDGRTIGFIPPNGYHEYRQLSGENSLVINIPENMIKKSDWVKLGKACTLLIDRKISLLIELIIDEIEDNPESESVKYLLFYLYDKLVDMKKSLSIDYINKNYNEDIAVKRLAEIENYSVNYYNEWFKKQTMMTPREYILNLRIEKAKELLVSTGYSITEIADQVGYWHSSSFTRVFKKLEKIGPKEYREKYKSEN